MKKAFAVLTSALILTVASYAKDVKTEIRVSGMSCQACAGGLQETLKAAKGVKECEVSYEQSVAKIVYDDTQTDEKQLRAAIDKTGFKAEPSKEKTK